MAEEVTIHRAMSVKLEVAARREKRSTIVAACQVSGADRKALVELNAIRTDLGTFAKERCVHPKRRTQASERRHKTVGSRTDEMRSVASRSIQTADA